MKRLHDYREIVGDRVLSDIYQTARKLYGKRVVHINSTYTGGGVAEILNSLAPLMNDVGIEAGWRILRGDPDFFNITKKFHNALQGDHIKLSELKKRHYINTCENFSVYTHFNHDCVIIHDPQPLPLIEFYKRRQPWIWRCHIDLSNPDEELWNFIKGFVFRYDHAIVSSEIYRRPDLPIQQRIFAPVIDPLTHKNMPLKEKEVDRNLKKHKIPTDKPILLQISRFDKWKDPLGVIDVYKRVKEEMDCRLVLCGSMASDDPEGLDIYLKVKKQANHMVETRDIILITYENNVLVNALQRKAAVILQKSIREGFGLTVTEGLWKGKPVVGSSVGGIPIQIQDGKTGFLVEPKAYDKIAKIIVDILKNPEMAKSIGKAGQEYVRHNFLITRLLHDYLKLFTELL
jgi:trehalose synthase